MSCGKRPLVKNWDRPKEIRVITPSRYEKNEASVKQHWKKVIRDLELSYKDDQFWESQSAVVQKLVGPVIFTRIAKIFDLPIETDYEPQSDTASIAPSEQFYKTGSTPQIDTKRAYSFSDPELVLTTEEEIEEEETSERWSISSAAETESTVVNNLRSKSSIKSKSFSRMMSKSFSKTINKSSAVRSNKDFSFGFLESEDESAHSSDDLRVNPKSIAPKMHARHKRLRNPHFDMLYCSQSETDMIKWNSKYKQKTFEVSASDEFSKKAEIMTKMISKEFFDWWQALGYVEFKSEIKRPEDIESLFQVWFDEHASRELVLDPKILPCVLQSIANYLKLPKAACSSVLKRQIQYDVHAETSPAHTTAFNTCLPHKMKHIPPKNNTKELWQGVNIPEELQSMAAVWEDIQHLTSTKSFRDWLKQRPHLPMPKCMQSKTEVGDKKQLFVVPSDFVVTDRSASISAQDLALPVSQFSLELKDVLSKLLQ